MRYFLGKIGNRRVDTGTSLRHQVSDMLMRFCVSVCNVCEREREKRETGEESREAKH